MDEQQILGIPVWASRFLTSIALIFFAVVVLSVCLHIFNPGRFPSPESLGAEALAAIGIVTIFATYFPWSSISFGGVKIERLLQQQAKEHAEELKDLLPQKTPSDTQNSSDTSADEIVDEVFLESALESVGNLETITKSHTEATQPARVPKTSPDPAIIENFLHHYDRWGFTPARILNWGAKQDKFEDLAKFSRAELRIALSDLVENGRVHIRVSSTGNILYQIVK